MKMTYNKLKKKALIRKLQKQVAQAEEEVPQEETAETEVAQAEEEVAPQEESAEVAQAEESSPQREVLKLK